MTDTRTHVWVVLDREEASIVAVTATAAAGKAAAEADAGTLGPLAWRERRDGRFHSTTLDYEVRPFEVAP